MKFGEVVGSIEIDVEHMKSFVGTWFEDEDDLVVVGFPVEGSRRVLSMALTKEILLEATPESFSELTRNVDNGRKYDLYVGVNPISDPESVTLTSRGSEENVKAVYGCFIDLDINRVGKKSGAFDNKDQILEFLDSIPLEPTIVVDNGSSGGIHAYWRFEDPIDMSESIAVKPYLVGWWAYLNSLTDRNIDRLIDVTRIARMPSSIYWPKTSSDKFDTVKVLKNTGKRYKRDDLLALTKEAYQRHCDTLDRIRSEKSFGIDVSLKNYAAEPGNSERLKELINLRPHNLNMLTALVEHTINDNYSWYDILEPYGWTMLKESSDGSLVWSRPGKLDRSAVTDYRRDDGVSQVMSLLSSSEETGLSDLKEAGVLLTKMQVLLRLRYNDNVIEMIDDVLKEVESGRRDKTSV